MSHRADKGDAQQRKPGRSGSSSNHRGFSGGGGKGGSAAPPPPVSSSAAVAAPAGAVLAANRSFKKPGNGQGQQPPRVNPNPSNSAHNGTHSVAPVHGPSDGPAPSGAKPVDMRSSKPLPKAPTSQLPEPTAPKTPRKADAPPAGFPLQFGTISTIMNGMQIPARTSSAPPNLDEQKLELVYHQSLVTIPTQPIPTAPKQQQQLPRKELGANPSRTVGAQTKRGAHAPIPSAPAATAMASLPRPLGAMHMPFQQSQIPLQFGVPNPQMQPRGVPTSSLQMTMGLPVGNAPQIPQQMFSGIHSHLQPQAMMHQGQNLGFTPQINHQLGPQINNMGIGPQFPQQQPGKFGGPAPQKSKVKITHPETHEELRLNQRTDSYMDAKSTGQRQHPNVPPQAQQIHPFSPLHQINYYSGMQPNSFNPQAMFFSPPLSLPSTQTATGSQPPRFGYPVANQGVQGLSFMNPSVMNQMPGSKSGPPSSLHSGPETVKLEGLPVSTPSGSVQVTKPPLGVFPEKVGRPSVTISAPISKADPSVTNTTTINKPELSGSNMSISKAVPLVTISPNVGRAESSVPNKVHISKAETTNLLKSSGGTAVSQLQKDREIGGDSSVQHSKPAPEPLDKKPASAVDKHAGNVLSALTIQRAEPAVSSSAPVTPIGDVGSVVAVADGRRKEPVRRSESFKDHQKKQGKKDRHSQQHHQTDVLDPAESRRMSSSNIIQDNNVIDAVSVDVSKQAPLVSDIANSTVSLPSSIEHATPPEVGTFGAIEDQAISIPAVTSEFALEKEVLEEGPSSSSIANELVTDGASSIKERGTSETSSSLNSEMAGTTCKGSDISVSPDENLSEENGYKQEISAVADDGKVVAFNGSPLDSIESKTCPSTVIEPLFQNEEEVRVENSEVVTCELSDDKDRKPVSPDEVFSSSLEADRTAGASDTCAATSSILLDPETVPSANLTSTAANISKPSPSDDLTDKPELISSQRSLMAPGKSFLEAANTPSSVSSEMPHTSDHKVIEMSNGDPVPVMLTAPKDKLPTDSTRSKIAGGRKKKRKEILSKADAAGASDLYNAYKGPGKTQDILSSTESAGSSLVVDAKNVSDVPDIDSVANEEDGVDKSEFDDWEDAADMSTPKLETSENGPQLGDGNEAMSKKYSRDFLFTFAEQCTELPMGFEIRSDIADVFSSPTGVSRESYPSSGRITDRPSGGPRGDRRMGGMMDDGKWNKAAGSFGPGVDIGHGPGATNFRPGQGGNHGVLRIPRGQVGGILSGPMQSPASHGVIPQNNADADRWQRASGFQKGLMPSPNTPLQVMHRAEKKYEVGKVSDKEEAKQRQLKGILNKLTPQNFEKLFEQVKEVNIDSAATLTGVISQIFDKALMEPTFCEMYANFCYHLAGALPDFTEDEELITFRRLLLNKCQEEFERGEREQAEAEKIEEEGEIKQSEQEREEKRLRARRRMLGNIRLIGELYKKKMLTERIMHECIKKLLGQYQNPDEEDIEALCKLMATIGEMIDHAKAKVHMDTYFEMMQKLSTNQKISSRVRFMLRDAIDLRKNKWQQRRKVEGPKKIDEVHRDAAQERHAQSSRLARGPVINSSSRRGPSVDYGHRGPAILTSPSSQQSGSIRSLPSQNRGYGQDVRLEERHQSGSRTLAVPQRHADESITLGPQGGLARGMSVRGQHLLSSVPVPEIHSNPSDARRLASGPNGHSAISDRVHYNSREEMIPRSSTDKFSGDRVDKSTATTSAGRTHLSSRPNTPEAKPLSEVALREMSFSAIREFYSAKDEDEVALCVKELNSPSFYPVMVSLWVMDSFERKDLERDLLAKLLVNLCKSHGRLLGHLQLIEGFKTVLSLLEDAVNDAPKAGEFLGRIFAKSVLENVCSLSELGRLIHEGGEEPGRLLEIGLASEVLGSILESIRTEKGDSVLADIRMSSNLRLEDFRPPHPMKSKKLDAFL